MSSDRDPTRRGAQSPTPMHRTGSMEHRWSPSQTMHPGSTGLTMVRQPSGGMPRALSAALDREMSGQLPPSVVPIVPARPGSGIPGHALELDPARWEPHAPVHGCFSPGYVGAVVELGPAQLAPGHHWWRRLELGWASMTA